MTLLTVSLRWVRHLPIVPLAVGLHSLLIPIPIVSRTSLMLPFLSFPRTNPLGHGITVVALFEEGPSLLALPIPSIRLIPTRLDPRLPKDPNLPIAAPQPIVTLERALFDIISRASVEEPEEDLEEIPEIKPGTCLVSNRVAARLFATLKRGQLIKFP